MSIGKALLNRVRKLERVKVSPMLKYIGSIDAFEADVQAGIDAGSYDPRDMPLIVNAMRRWLDEAFNI